MPLCGNAQQQQQDAGPDQLLHGTAQRRLDLMRRHPDHQVPGRAECRPRPQVLVAVQGREAADACRGRRECSQRLGARQPPEVALRVHRAGDDALVRVQQRADRHPLAQLVPHQVAEVIRRQPGADDRHGAVSAGDRLVRGDHERAAGIVMVQP
jgi:hypothetical protein